MPQHDLVLGLDVGTTNLECLALDEAGTIVAQGSEPTPRSHPRPDWTDFEPEPIWEAACRAIRAVVSQIENPAAIRGIAISSFGESVVPIDSRGQPLAPAIAWFDLRNIAESLAFEKAKHWLHFADYVAFRLCGIPATDPSLACRSLAYDLARGNWACEILEAVGVPPSSFPPVCKSGTPLGLGLVRK